MTRLFAIARNAFIETIRQPIYVVLILVTFGVLVLDLPLSGWTMGTGMGDFRQTDQQMMINLGLSTLLVSGLFIAAFSAAGVLTREIEDKTILTVVSKPVARPMVVLGKFLGVAGALVVAYYLCSLVFLMTVRHKVMPTASDTLDVPVIVLGCSALALTVLAALFCNYFFGWNVSSASVSFGVVVFTLAMAVIAFVGKKWVIVPFGQGISPDVLVAMLLMLFSVLVFAAVAIAASTRLGQVMTLLVCVGFFFLGSMSQYVFGRLARQSLLGQVAYWLWPNLTVFYALDALTQGRSIPIVYVALAGGYAFCYIAAILAVGVALFQRRELEAQPGATSAPRAVSLLAWLGRTGALAAAVLAVTMPWRLGTLSSVALAAAALIAGVAGWIFWGWFGRGVKWTYYLAMFLIVCGLGMGIALTAAGRARDWLNLTVPLATAVVVIMALALALLLFPKTRHHFGFVRKLRRPAAWLARR